MARADRPSTSAWRLALAIVAAYIAAAVAVVASIFLLTNRLLTEQSLTIIAGEVVRLKERLDQGGIDGLRVAVRERSIVRGPGLYLLVDGNGRKLEGNLDAMPTELASGARGVFTFASLEGPRLAAGLVLPVPGSARLVVGQDLEDHRRLIRGINLALIAGVGFMALVGLGGGMLVHRRILGRIDRAVKASEAIMAGNLRERLPEDGGSDEISHLTGAINVMLGRIDALMTGMREISDNIAHDLKTPLMRLRARAEAALAAKDGDGGAGDQKVALQRVIEDADGLIATFNSLLLIARLEAGVIAESMTRVDLRDIARDLIDLYEPAAEEAGFRLVLQAPAPVPTDANRELMAQALANLIDNAIKYSRRAQATVANDREIVIEVVDEGERARLSVADRGPGIASADRKRALGRFVRLEESRSLPGTGLGLSLVAAVVRLHGGAIDLEDNAPGLRVVLRFPRGGGSRL